MWYEFHPPYIRWNVRMETRLALRAGLLTSSLQAVEGIEQCCLAGRCSNLRITYRNGFNVGFTSKSTAKVFRRTHPVNGFTK